MLTADGAEKAALLIYCTETMFCRNLYVQMCSPELLDTISDQCQCVRILKSIVSKSKYLYASHWVRVLFVGVGLHCSCSCNDAGIARKLIDADPASLESTARKVRTHATPSWRLLWLQDAFKLQADGWQRSSVILAVELLQVDIQEFESVNSE